jgi:sulfur-carrier protein adenylyltransferase/sulfurtransferase
LAIIFSLIKANSLRNNGFFKKDLTQSKGNRMVKLSRLFFNLSLTTHIKMNFTKAELTRYARHFSLPDFGLEGQMRLKNGSVLVVGAGGLGSPVLLYLAAAGVGRIGIIDADKVDDSNLQRQVLYTTEDIGQCKVQAAKKRLLALNPYIQIDTYTYALRRDNALEIVEKYDVVADGTDNFATRYLVNDACVLCGKVNVYASIFRFEGQVSVFNFNKKVDEKEERGVNYRDLFPAPPPPDLVPNCAEGGVLGVLPGIIGSMQANEVLKILSGVGEPLAGRLFVFDAASFSTRILKVVKNPNYQPITELIDYDVFCGVIKTENSTNTIKNTLKSPVSGEKDGKSIDVKTLHRWRTLNLDFQLIDVREPYEYEAGNLGGVSTPLSILTEKMDLIDRGKPVVVHCKTGARSAKAIEQLEALGIKNLLNLRGGIQAYALEIDSTITVI